MVGAGLALDDRLLAVVCASHDGRPEHVAAVREILAGAGLADDDLDNTPALPLDAGAAMRAIVRAGGGPDFDHSRTAAASMPGCWRRRASTAGRRPATSTRTTRCNALILDDLARAGRRGDHVGVDGCGAPAPVMSLSAWPGPCARLAVDGHAVHRAMTGAPRDGRRPDARRHAADAAGAGTDGQGRRRGRAGGRPARRPGGRPEDRRRRRPGPDAGDGRRAAARSASTVARGRRSSRSVLGHGEPSARSSLAGADATVTRGPGVPAARRASSTGASSGSAPMLRRVDRREPVEVHVPRHRHVHRRARARSPSSIPGPTLDTHRDALHAGAGRRAGRRRSWSPTATADHSPLAAWLRAETGAPTYAFGPHPPPDPRRTSEELDEEIAEGVKIEESTDLAFEPDVRVADGEVAATGPGLDDQRRAHARAHVEPHVLRVRRGGRAVPRRPRDGVEHDRRVAARRRHDGVHRLAAQGRRAAATARTGRRTGRRSRSRSATSTRSSTTACVRERQVLDAVRGGLGEIPAIVAAALRRRRREAAQAGRPVGAGPPRASSSTRARSSSSTATAPACDVALRGDLRPSAVVSVAMSSSSPAQHLAASSAG